MAGTGIILPTRDYDLSATLNSGQVFRWQLVGEGWEGVVNRRWVRLVPRPGGLEARTATPVACWRWLADFLQSEAPLEPILASFPPDAPLQAARDACAGLRLLRQDPWECLVSFICSSTKQIVQIRQILAHVCERFGDPVPVPPGAAPAFAFPAPERLAACSEAELRACRMGFRAASVRAAAQRVSAGDLALDQLAHRTLDEARAELRQLPGVGPKIADCVLLFAAGHATAFPLDVWVMKALRELYFNGRHVTATRLRQFSATHFGPCAGYAQQYLFHYMRTQRRPPPVRASRLQDARL
jgi:N-glycosylase/DNA lyase